MVMQMYNALSILISATQKGNVAATMGSHELLVTELLLCNMFEEMKPEEIAAVLSCLVCESKSNIDLEQIKEPNLINVYIKGIQIFHIA